MKRILIAAAAAAAAALAPTASANTSVGCGHGNPSVPLPLTVNTPDYGQGIGYYTLPAGRPKGLVVFAHGFGNSAKAWFAGMQKVSSQTGAITIAMYNPGETIGRNGMTSLVPRVVGPISRPGPVGVRDLQFLKSLTTRSVKVTAVGPLSTAMQ